MTSSSSAAPFFHNYSLSPITEDGVSVGRERHEIGGRGHGDELETVSPIDDDIKGGGRRGIEVQVQDQDTSLSPNDAVNLPPSDGFDKSSQFQPRSRHDVVFAAPTSLPHASYRGSTSTNGGSFSSACTSGGGSFSSAMSNAYTFVAGDGGRRTSDMNPMGSEMTMTTVSAPPTIAGMGMGTPPIGDGNDSPAAGSYSFSTRVDYPMSAAPTTMAFHHPPQDVQQPYGRVIGAGYGGMAFGAVPGGNDGRGGGASSMSMLQMPAVDPRAFQYDAAAALPPISQDFVRPNIDDSRRPATSAGIMMRSFGSGYGVGFGAGFGAGYGGSAEGLGPLNEQQPAAMSDQNRQWQGVQTTSGDNGGAQQYTVDEDADDLKDVFSHTVDVNGASILGGPAFQDPFAIEAAEAAAAASRDADQNQVAPDRVMTAGSVDVGMQQIALNPTASSSSSVPRPAGQFAVPAHSSASPSSPWSSVSRRASEPHFKANPNISLPSHASLYQTLGLGQIMGGGGGESMPSNQQQALAMAAFAARRGSKDVGPNQLRQLIAQRRGSSDRPGQGGMPMMGSSPIRPPGSAGSGGSPHSGGISPAQISWRAGTQRRPVSQGNVGYVDPRMTFPRPVDDGWQDRYAPATKTVDPGQVNAYGRPGSSGYRPLAGDERMGGQMASHVGGYPAAAAAPAASSRYRQHGEQVGSGYESRHPVGRAPPSVLGAYPTVPQPAPPSVHLDPGGATVDSRRNAWSNIRRVSAPAAGNPAGQTGGTNGSYGGFDSQIGPMPKKRPRRKFDQIERLYLCGHDGCEKSYGTLNHLNAHVSMQKHGLKRRPEEFKEIRKEWRKRKKEEAALAKAEAAANAGSNPHAVTKTTSAPHSSHGEDSYDEDEHWRDDEHQVQEVKRGHELAYPQGAPLMPTEYEQQQMMGADAGKWASNAMPGHMGIPPLTATVGEYDMYVRR